MARAPLVEIFHSIQGEGRYVGVGMEFLRVAVCPIRCRYCDTPESYTAAPSFSVSIGDDAFSEPNPVTPERAAELVGRVAEAAGDPGGQPVSLTGGEPLVYPQFLRRTGEILQAEGRSVHLETAALDPGALSEMLEVVDHLSADYKLPETLEQGDFRAAHRSCVEMAVAAGRTVDVKIVLTSDLVPESYTRALEDLAPWRGEILLVLQPATPFGGVQPAPWPELRTCLHRALEAGFEARLLPQVHRSMGLR
jgi:organic radical activating enzyme